MPRLIWSAPALRDVSRLHRFLAAKNPDAAMRGIKAIRKSVKLLERHPLAGRLLPGLPAAFREWPVDFGVGTYVVQYRIEADDVVVLAVRHSRELAL